MLDGAPTEVLAGHCWYRARVTAWLGGQLLAAEVPISSGRITGKVDDDIIETLTLTVPRFAAPVEGADQIDWRPGDDARHPLGRYGQQLDVTIVVTSVVNKDVWETRRGRYQIKDWDDDDDGNISVKAESLLARPRDHKLRAPISPTGTFATEAQRLVPDGMGVEFDAALVDRTCPSAMAWSEGRLEALQEIARAWPALLRIDPWGQVLFKAPLPSVPSPVLTLRDGEGGTLIRAPRRDSREGAPNMVIVYSGSTDSADVVGVAAITAGPMSIYGDYGVVAKKWSSSTIETEAQAQAAARVDLANSSRPAQSVPVTIAPDPRIEMDDAIEILRTGDQRRLWGWVTGYDIPLTAADGAMRIDVGVTG